MNPPATAPLSTLDPPPSRAALVLAAMALLIITIIAYVPAMSAGFIWDDDSYVTNNPTLRDVHGLGRIWLEIGATPQYYPLVHTSFWVEWHLWGLNATGYHIVNIVLHGLGSGLVFVILRRLGFTGVAAWFAGAIFAVHPVHVESVAWITERKNVLSALFYFLAMLAYWRAVPPDGSSNPAAVGGRRIGSYIAALVLFACALASKTVTCTLPAALLLIMWWKRGRVTRADVLPTIPMFILGAAAGLLTAWMEKHHVGASGEEWNYSLIERCLIAGRVAWFYVGTNLWPVNLAFIYPRWSIDAHQLRQWIYPLAALAAVAGLWLGRKRLGRGPLVAVLYFGGTLFPALGFFDVYPFRFSFVADHFQHLASLGLVVLVVGCVAHAAQRLGPVIENFASVIGGCVLLALGALTWKQCGVYHDLETLWTDTLHKNPGSFMPHYNLGKIYTERGESARAIAEYEQALQAKPDFAEAANNMGVEYARLGDTDKAMMMFNKALAMPGIRPDVVADVYNGMGGALARMNQFEQAIATYQKALAIDETFIDPRINLGIAYARLNQPEQAEREFRRVIQINPRTIKGHYNLGLTLEKQNRLSEAISEFQQVTQLDPAFLLGYYKLGLVNRSNGEPAKAIEQFERALDIQPGAVDVRNALAQTLQQSGRSREAIEHLRVITQLTPNDPQAYANLAQMLLDQHDPLVRDPQAAIANAQRAVALAGPQRKAAMYDLLAQCYADAEQWAQATRAAEQALMQARVSGQAEVLDQLQQRLDSYRSRASGSTPAQQVPPAGPQPHP